MIEKTTNHIEQAIDLLFEQYKKPINGNVSASERLQSLVSCFVNQIQGIEDACDNLKKGALFNSCTTDALNRYGQISGEPRNARNDIDYRVGIKSRLILNRASGTLSDFITLLINSGITTGISIIETSDACVDFTANYDFSTNIPLVQQIKRVVSAGVTVNIYNKPFLELPFVLSDINSALPPVGGMLYDLVDPNPGLAGKLIDVL